MSNSDPSPIGPIGPSLVPADAEALDALVESGMRPEVVPAPARERASLLARLLGLLDGGPVEERHQRVARVMSALPGEPTFELSGDDAEALDAWVIAGFDTAK